MVDTSLDNKAFVYRGFSAVTILPPRSLLHPPLTPIRPSDRSEHAGHWMTSGNSWYPFVLVASYSFSFQMLIAVCDYIPDEFCNMQTVSSLRADTGAFSQHHCIIPGNCLAHGTAWRISGIQKHVLNEWIQSLNCFCGFMTCWASHTQWNPKVPEWLLLASLVSVLDPHHMGNSKIPQWTRVSRYYTPATDGASLRVNVGITSSETLPSSRPQTEWGNFFFLCSSDKIYHGTYPTHSLHHLFIWMLTCLCH